MSVPVCGMLDCDAVRSAAGTNALQLVALRTGIDPTWGQRRWPRTPATYCAPFSAQSYSCPLILSIPSRDFFNLGSA